MARGEDNMPIVPILDQHAEEAAFNWLLRSSAVGEPHFDLADLINLDDRVEAHLDGLRIAAEAGWSVCREAMAIEEPGEIFTAGILAFESKDPERMDYMLEAVETDSELQRALISAMGWIDFETIAEPACKLMSADLPFLRYLGVAAFAVHRRDPGAVFSDLLRDPDAAVRVRAVKAAGELGRVDLLPLVAAGYQHENDSVRYFAARSGALLGDARAAAALQVAGREQSPWTGEAVRLAACSLAPSQAHAWLRELTQQREWLRLAVQGYGALGDPEAVGWLISLMHQPELARVAGEACSMITGVDIAYENLETDATEDFQAGPSEEPEDNDVAPDPDEDLPWPDPDLVATWWQERKSEFQNGTCYLAGKPVNDTAHLRTVLKTGFQRQRIAASLALALTRPGEPLFEYRAPGYRQHHMLGLAKQRQRT